MTGSLTQDQSAIEIDVKAQRGEFLLQSRFCVPANGVTALFGASGSGKTSLLRAIAGFDSAVGRISAGDEVWLDTTRGIDVKAHLRGVGYMFQDARLFPHLSVLGNLDYARRRAERREEVVAYATVVDAFELEPLLPRSAGELSGGETQRVALARTLLSQPRLVLLDEPLAALDEQRKRELLPYLETLVGEFELPMFYVSHDVDEVARLADRMVVLKAGAVQAVGTTAEVFGRLDLQDSIGRFEASSLLAATVIEQIDEWQLTRLALAGQQLVVPKRAGLKPGDSVRLRVRARDVALATQAPAGTSIRNILAGRIERLVTLPDTPYSEVAIELEEPDGAGVRLGSRITRAAAADLALKPGDRVFALIKSVTFDF